MKWRGRLQNRNKVPTALLLYLVVAGIGALAALSSRDSLVGRVTASSQSGLNARGQGEAAATGRLLVALQGSLSLLPLPNGQPEPLVGFDSRGLVTSVRWRPGGTGAVYSFLELHADHGGLQADIYLTELTGAPRVLLHDNR